MTEKSVVLGLDQTDRGIDSRWSWVAHPVAVGGVAGADPRKAIET